jgi:hypothetical protein
VIFVLARQFQVSGTAKSDGSVQRLDQPTTDHYLDIFNFDFLFLIAA